MKENSAQLYGQVTQDGCSPVLCTSPAWPCLLPLSHMTHLSKPFPQAPASDCSYQNGSEGHAPIWLPSNQGAHRTSVPL